MPAADTKLPQRAVEARPSNLMPKINKKADKIKQTFIKTLTLTIFFRAEHLQHTICHAITANDVDHCKKNSRIPQK